MACVSASELVYWERRFGSNDSGTSNEFLRNLLKKIAEEKPLDNVVLVVGNAPCHSRAERVFQESEYRDGCLLRLGPYTPMLNPIEKVFLTIKSQVKKFLALHRQSIIRASPPGVTIKAHRASYLARAAGILIDEVVTEQLCAKCVRHSVSFHRDVLNFRDVQLGK